MRLVDANVLLYAVNADADQHQASRSWLDAALGGADTIGFDWVVLLAFLRLSCRPDLFPRPLPTGDGLEQVSAWLAAPGAALVHPESDHPLRLAALLTAGGGNLVNDAHLAALALSRRASLVTYDADFRRFDGLRVERPDDLI